jgi:hypothetical protein
VRVIYELYATISDPEGKVGEPSCVLVIYSFSYLRHFLLVFILLDDIYGP